MSEIEANRRTFSRSPVRVAVALETDEGDAVLGRVDNVSINGIHVACDKRFPEGTECTIVVTLTLGEEELTIESRGVVARVEPTGLAVHFEDIDPDSLDHLRNLVRYNAADADVVDQELDHTVGIKPAREQR